MNYVINYASNCKSVMNINVMQAKSFAMSFVVKAPVKSTNFCRLHSSVHSSELLSTPLIMKWKERGGDIWLKSDT